MKEGWQRKSFAEVVDIINGKNQRDVQAEDGQYPIYGSAGSLMGYANSYLCEAGTTIIGRKGNINSPVFVETPFWNVDTAFGLHAKSGLIPKFLHYFCLSYDFSAHNRGTTIPSLVKTELLSLSLPVPPLPEQYRIVAILDEAFEVIATAKANAEKTLQSTRELFESYREALLTGGVDGWQAKKLSDLCEVKHGFAFKSEHFAHNGEYVLLTPGNFFESGGYRDRGEKQKYYVGDIPAGFVLSEGDLLAAMTEQAAGLLGSPILVPESGVFLHNQRLGLVKSKPGVPWLNPFFFHVFNLRSFRREVHASATGVKVRHTSPSKIGEIEVKFPSDVSVQKQIVSQLDSISDEVARLSSVHKQKLSSLDDLKKSLLHHAFSGQL